MTQHDGAGGLPVNFSGPVRLFPLPKLVMFPHVIQPLHVFEERYRVMVRDALDDDRLIAMAMLKPGWEARQNAPPPIESVICIGRIVAHTQLADGCYNLCLQGVARACIRSELPAIRPFRRALVNVLAERLSTEDAAALAALRRRLICAFRRHLVADAKLNGDLECLLKSQVSLGALTDVMAYALPIDEDVKLMLLGEADVARRAAMLVEHLSGSTDRHRPARPLVFPPAFSCN
jgi:Lon protease-like protein